MARAKGIDWKQIVVIALHLLVCGGRENTHNAVRDALKENDIDPRDVSMDQYDNLTTAVDNLNQTLQA